MADERAEHRCGPQVLTAEQVGKWLQVPVYTVLNQYRAKNLRGVKIGRHLRFRPADVRNYIEMTGE